jgi:hypothetical protein
VAALIIRKVQMDVVRDELRSRLVKTVTVHARECFPEECAAMGEEQLLHRMEDAAAAAARWGLGSPQDVCRFVNLSMILGPGFDSDPKLKWIYEMLSDAGVPSRSQRLSLVYAEAVRRLRAGGQG